MERERLRRYTAELERLRQKWEAIDQEIERRLVVAWRMDPAPTTEELTTLEQLRQRAQMIKTRLDRLAWRIALAAGDKGTRHA